MAADKPQRPLVRVKVPKRRLRFRGLVIARDPAPQVDDILVQHSCPKRSAAVGGLVVRIVVQIEVGSFFCHNRSTGSDDFRMVASLPGFRQTLGAQILSLDRIAETAVL